MLRYSTLVTVNVKINYLTLIMEKSTLIYAKQKKIAGIFTPNLIQLNNRYIVAVNIKLNVSSLTLTLMVNYLTSN